MSTITVTTQKPKSSSLRRVRGDSLKRGDGDGRVSRTVEQNTNESNTKSQSLLDLQLVEPWPHDPVPDHLLETKKFFQKSENDVVCATPAYVQFAGFQPGKVLCRGLELLNKSGDVQRFHIIPPQTKYFGLKYKKDRRLVPGFSVSCVVEFYPDECRYFYDCIRIHCQGDDNLIIPVHAFPVLDLSEFPRIIDFPPVPIGESKTRSFRLRSVAPVCFNYQLTCIEENPAFIVEPLSGTVPANEELKVKVTFSPTAFITSTMYLRLDVNQFRDFDPLYCSVTGHSYPGLTAERRLESYALDVACRKGIAEYEAEHEKMSGADAGASDEEEGTSGALAETVCVTPLDRVRQRRLNAAASSSQRNQSKTINQSHSSRNATSRTTSQPQAMTRKMKESQFESMRKEEITRERMNQLRWQTKLGSDPVTSEFCTQVIRDRNSNQSAIKCVDYRCAELRADRTTRDACQMALCCPTFDNYTNNCWLQRRLALERFRCAASKVIVRSRACHRLKILKSYLSATESTATCDKQCSGKSTLNIVGDSSQVFKMVPEKVSDPVFPAEPKVPEDDIRDALALGPVPTLPSEIRLREHINFFPLKVCPQYKLLGYKRHSVQQAADSYVPRHMVRKLRTGAEDELITLSTAPVTVHPCLVAPLRQCEGLVELKDECEGYSQAVSLVPPSGLYEPIRYHPLHVFNQVPGVRTYEVPLWYSSVDADYHLCPLPRFPALSPLEKLQKSTQKHFLDRDDYIKGVMSWKKFPSPTIIATANTPSLVNIWVPQWSDPFNIDLLPAEPAGLQNFLAEEDRLNIIDNRCAGGGPCEVLTFDSVKDEAWKMFNKYNPQTTEQQSGMENSIIEEKHLPTSNIPFGPNGQIQREQREVHLMRYLHTKRHLLNDKIDSRVNDMCQPFSKEQT